MRARSDASQVLSTALERVDVLRPGPDGRVWVALLGREQLASAESPLTPGQRLLLEVRTTADGIVLRQPDASASLDKLAASILRESGRTDVPAMLDSLLAETDSIDTPQAKHLQAAIAKLRPANEAPDAATVQRNVADGGVQYEAKLAALAGDPRAAREAWTGVHRNDLKAAVLDLLRSVAEVASVPATRETLDRIEAAQAANVLSTSRDGPLVVPVPFPDGDGWTTARLAIQPERDAEGVAESHGSFTFWTDVTLSDLGELWVEARHTPDAFRAVIYQSSSAAAAALVAELGSLETELKAGGTRSVSLDVRPMSDLTLRQRRLAVAMHVGRGTAESILNVEA